MNFEFLTFQTSSAFQGSSSSIAASTFQRSSSSFQSSAQPVFIQQSSSFLPHLPRLSLPRPAENEISVHFEADVEADVEAQDGYNSFTSQFFDTSEASDRWKEVVDSSAVFPDDASVDLGNINGETELFPGSPHRLKVFVIFCILFFSSTSLLTSKCL
jgi:hypothetical protein